MPSTIIPSQTQDAIMSDTTKSMEENDCTFDAMTKLGDQLFGNDNENSAFVEEIHKENTILLNDTEINDGMDGSDHNHPYNSTTQASLKKVFTQPTQINPKRKNNNDYNNQKKSTSTID